MEPNHPEHAEKASETKQPTPAEQTSKATDASGLPSSEQPIDMPAAVEHKKVKVKMSVPQPEPAPSAAAATDEEWVRPLTFWERVKVVVTALLEKIPPQARLGIGIAAAPIGAGLGALAASWLINVNYNGVVLPSALGGILCGLLSGRRSFFLGIYSAVVGLIVGLLVEYRLAEYCMQPPPFTEEDLAYYFMHLNQIPRMQVIHIVIGVAIGFFFGIGRSGAEKPTATEEESITVPAGPVTDEQPTEASATTTTPVAPKMPTVKAQPTMAESKQTEPEPVSKQESAPVPDAPVAAEPDGKAAGKSADAPSQEDQPAAPAPEADASPVPSAPKEEEKKP